jgi:GxxExxY protein
MREPRPELNELANRVIGAAIEVHRILGPGFLEQVYEAALCREFEIRGIPFVRQPTVEIGYKGYPIGQGRLDLLVDGQLVVELKSVEALIPLYTAQLLSYLRVTGHELGLLINFDAPQLKQGLRRVILSHDSATSSRSPRLGG